MMKKIYVSEKRVSVEYAYRMLQKGKLSFPETPLRSKRRIQERLSEIMELILLGAAVPAIYVSELQDGSWLVLETTDRLWALFQFLNGKRNMGYMDMYPEYTEMSLAEMEKKVPHVTSMIYDYKLQIQVIDYMTPRYLHLQIGSNVERWNFSREQGVRKALYSNYDAVSQITMLEKQLDKRTFFFSSSTLNRQYTILRIYMYRLVFLNRIRTSGEDRAGVQLLLDQTMELLDAHEREAMAVEEFESATNAILSLGRDKEIAERFQINRGKEQQIRRISYLYNLIWLVDDGQISMIRFHALLSSQRLWERIEKDDVNYENIRHHYDMILRDRGNR